MISIMAILAGAEGPTSIAKWALLKSDFLLQQLDLPYGIPRKDVFRRVLSALNPLAFQTCFASWLHSLRDAAAKAHGVEPPILAIDDKTLRRSHNRSTGLGAQGRPTTHTQHQHGGRTTNPSTHTYQPVEKFLTFDFAVILRESCLEEGPGEESVVSQGKRETESQQEFWTPTDQLARGPGHVFYDKLNRLLSENGFDLFVEPLCQPYYKTGGRPSIPPGVYFRMLMIGYLEGLDSQRGIAWRCEDSLALRRFLGIGLSEETPDHSSLTRIRDRLPLSVHEEVFRYILFVIEQHGLLKGKSAGVDSTFLEANAAMKSIVRKDTGEDWKAYLKRLMKEEGLLKAGR